MYIFVCKFKFVGYGHTIKKQLVKCPKGLISELWFKKSILPSTKVKYLHIMGKQLKWYKVNKFMLLFVNLNLLDMAII